MSDMDRGIKRLIQTLPRDTATSWASRSTSKVYEPRAEEIIALDLPGLLQLVAFSADRRDFATIERPAEIVADRRRLLRNMLRGERLRS